MPQLPSLALTPASVVTRNPALLSAELDGEVVLLHVEQGRYFGMTEVGGDLWRWLERPISVEALCRRVMAEYEVDRGVAEADVLEFLLKLQGQDLIAVA